MALGPFYVAQKLKQTNGPHGTAILMRHGETEWNKQGRVMGRNPVELTEHGRAQVAATARFAESIKPDLIVTSPLVRARQSAEILAAALGGIEIRRGACHRRSALRSLGGVALSRANRRSALRHLPEIADYAPTPGGETIPEVQARGVEAVMRMIEAHPGERIVFVSHGDIVRTVLCHFLKVELEHFHRIRVDNAALSAIQISGEFAEVKFLNLTPIRTRLSSRPSQPRAAKPNRPNPSSEVRIPPGTRGRTDRTMRVSTLIASILFLLCGFTTAEASSEGRTAAIASATKVALGWLKLVDEGSYAASWTAASSLFKGQVSEAGWTSGKLVGTRSEA